MELDEILERCRTHGVPEATLLRELDEGFTANLWTVHVDPACGPVAVVKAVPANSTRLVAEAAALKYLARGGSPGRVPKVLGAWGSGSERALVLEWLARDARSFEEALVGGQDLSGAAREFGGWLARLHGVHVEPGHGVKLSEDPVPWVERAQKQVERAVSRWTKRRGGDAEVSTRALVERARERFASALGGYVARPSRMVHRDLRAANLITDAGGGFVGVVDFERSAATDPAWDMVKLEWWLFDAWPELRGPAREGYEEVAAWPEDDAIELFGLLEALTLFCVFDGKHPIYPVEAIEQMRSLVDGGGLATWRRPLGLW